MTRRDEPVAGLLLAAGAGRRLGTAKALVSFGGTTLAERGACTLTDGGCDPVVVVLGAAADQVREVCELGGALVVVNEGWDEGMGGSVRVGLAEVERAGVSAVLVMPVDQPLVTARLVERLIATWRSCAAGAVVATYGGEMSTPVLLDKSLWPDVKSHAVGDVGARAFLRSNLDLVTAVACDDVGDQSDIDTRDDLLRLQSMLA